jgi:anaerobic C4-dicarboxylate transporter
MVAIMWTLSWEITMIFSEHKYPSWEAYVFFIFAIGLMIFSYKKIKTINLSQPQKDEMTRRRSEKAAAYSFYVIVTIVLYLIAIPEEPVITMKMIQKWGAAAIMSIYGISWFFIKIRGIRNE